MGNNVVIAGATGNLGERIARALVKKGASVRAVVRSTTDPARINHLERIGLDIFRVEHWNLNELTAACEGTSCVVSALAGLRPVIIDAQKVLVDAAVAAGVPRFIPSDYSLDFTPYKNGENRNFDLRREFHRYLDKTRIASTSIFNGAFTELLTGDMPMIFFKQKSLLHWGEKEHDLQFTTMDDTAAYTANVALDAATPRYLHIAGDLISPLEMQSVLNEITGKKFKRIRTGGQTLLGLIIKITKTLSPSKNDLYPAWQGMQYMHNMIDKRAAISRLDNDRYPGMQWTTVKAFLKQRKADRG